MIARARTGSAMIPRLASGRVRVAPWPFGLTQLQFQARRAAHRHAPDSLTYDLQKGRVNPPASTLPAPLDVPAFQADRSMLMYLYSSGKAYYQFYWTGVKNIWKNHKIARQLRLDLAQRGKTVGAAVSNMTLTRGEWQMLRRQEHDFRRLPLFGLLLVIFGEFLPLIILSFTHIVPLPCRIPSQVEQRERGRERQRHDSCQLLAQDLARLGLDHHHGTDLAALAPPRIDFAAVDRDLAADAARARSAYLVYAVRSFNLRSTRWPDAVPTELWRRKLRRHLAYLATDDTLLKHDGGPATLRPDEVRFACAERGIDMLGRSDKAVRADLKNWVYEKKTRQWQRRLFDQ